MPGSKPLSSDEFNAMLHNMRSKRDKCLLVLGTLTGFRISELLSLTISDCIQYDTVRDSITVSRCNMKGRTTSRSVKLHSMAQMHLKEYIGDVHDSSRAHSVKLFPFSRQYADLIIKRAAVEARVPGRVSTHSMRKTFAKRVYDALDHDLVNTQRAMGHKSVTSTVSYLSFDQETVDNAILKG